jgi:signal transduction histidine kinase
VLAEHGLDAALRDLGQRAPQVTVAGQAGDGLPAGLAAVAYFVAAEGLTNALRHSGASMIELHVGRRNGSLQLAIRDDGCGGARDAGGSGLTGLRERVAHYGGTLALSSPVGAGTRLSVELPLTAVSEP